MSQKKSSCLKMYDHVQNMCTCLLGKRSPGVGAALTMPFLPSFVFSKDPETHKQNVEGWEGLKTRSSCQEGIDEKGINEKMKEKPQSGLTGVIREGAGMNGLEEDGLKELLGECSGKGEDEDGRSEIELAG